MMKNKKYYNEVDDELLGNFVIRIKNDMLIGLILLFRLKRFF